MVAELTLDNRALRTALGQRALKLSEPYTWDRFTQRMVELYQAVVPEGT